MARRLRILVAVLAIAGAVGIAGSAELGSQAVSAKQGDLQKLNGTWILADANNSNFLSFGWYSTLLIKDGKFSISKFCGGSKSRNGSFRVNEHASPKSVDFDIDAIDVSEIWEGMTYAKASVAGIYKLDGDRLTICFADSPQARPKEFESEKSRDIDTLSFVRAKPDFKSFPKNITVRVVDPVGKPVAGASLFRFMNAKRESVSTAWTWKYSEIVKTGADGTAPVPYETFKGRAAGVRAPERHLMGFATITPASSVSGVVNIALQPECHVRGTFVSKDFSDAGRHDLSVMMTLNYNGKRFGFRPSDGKFDFAVPPGKYSINAYDRLLENRWIDVNVPSGVTDFEITPPINLTASNLFRLEGHPAPEPEGVVGWHGKPVKFSDLRGKYVLVEFWGHWCGPCIYSMPVLIDLHERFKDKGLAIVGVHLDLEGDVLTPEQYGAKIATIKKDIWKGKDLPFPVALTSEADGRHSAAKQYGIYQFPTTLLIDRQGIVVGDFNARDEKDAVAQVEKLLKPGK